MEILELKSAITDTKKVTGHSPADLSRGKEELANLKVGPPTQSEQQNKNRTRKSGPSCGTPPSTRKHTKRGPGGGGEGEGTEHASESKRRAQRIFEKIMAPNFPNLMKNIHLYIAEAQQILRRTNSN